MTQPSRKFPRVPAAFATRMALQVCACAAFALSASHAWATPAAKTNTPPPHPVHTPVRVAAHSAASAQGTPAKTKRVAGHGSGHLQESTKDNAMQNNDAAKKKSAPPKKTPAPTSKPSAKSKSADDSPAAASPKTKPSTHKRHKAIEPDGDPQMLQQASAPLHADPQTEKFTATHDKNVRHLAAVSVHNDSAQTTTTTAQTDDHGRATTEDFLRAAGASSATAAVPDADNETQDARGTSDPDAIEAGRINTQPATQKTLARSAVTTQPSAARVAAVAAAANDAKAAVPVSPKTSPKPAAKALSAKAAARNLMPADRDEEARVIDAALVPNVLPKLITASGRLIVPPPMKGTHDILVHQNFMADNAGLSRIQDDNDLDRMLAQHLLSPIASSPKLIVNPELPLDRRYARPWTVQMVNDISRDFYAKFHQPLRLNSAVRTVAYQLRLQRVNGNAAAVDGDTASPHLTGQAVDFGKKGMSVAQIAWMRLYLAPLMTAGKLDVEEEFQQACFHISVYRSYAPAARRPAKTELAQLHSKPAPIVRMPPGDEQTSPDAEQ